MTYIYRNQVKLKYKEFEGCEGKKKQEKTEVIDQSGKTGHNKDEIYLQKPGQGHSRLYFLTKNIEKKKLLIAMVK